MQNREHFLWWAEAKAAIDLIVPEHATKAKIELDSDEGYWVNVWWNCGVIAPLTTNELLQAKEQNNVESTRIPNSYRSRISQSRDRM